MANINKAILILALLLAAVGCQRTNPKILPDELTGFWTTEAESYRGRFLELTKTYVIIGAGEQGSPGVQVIDTVEAQRTGGGTLYTIDSTTEDGRQDHITLEFNSHEGGEIRLRNHSDVLWKRSGPNAANR